MSKQPVTKQGHNLFIVGFLIALALVAWTLYVAFGPKSV